MALKLWRPLTKDLSNYGILNEGSISKNTIVFTEGGKVGNKYATGVLTQHFTTDFLENTWSIAIWVKKTDSFASTNQVIFAKNGSNTSSNCQIYFSIANGNKLNIGVNGTSSSISYSYAFSLDTWYHVAATYNGSLLCLYINGLQVSTKTVTTAKKEGALNVVLNARSSNTAGTSYTATGGFQLNDFRFYDNAISPTEIKELSKGLILHYKFDSNTSLIDCSGNRNNGTLSETCVLETTTPRYSTSLRFDSSSKYGEVLNLNPINFINIYTISWWSKFIANPSKKIVWSFSDGNKLSAYYYSNTKIYLNTGDDTNNPFSGTYSFGTGWHHYVMTGDGTTTTLYIDGILKGTATTFKELTGTTIYFNGREDLSTTYKFNGNISDFRLYATCLTQNDILELYHTGAKIDSKNKFHTYEAVENQPITKITKQGQVKVLEVNENNKISFDETGDLNTFELIEI